MIRQNFKDNWLFWSENNTEKNEITLPHDAMLYARRDQESTGGSSNAFFYGDIYTYEKTFWVPEDWRNQYVAFEFEGIYKNSTIYINGIEAGGRPYGYTAFTVEANEFLKYGIENTIKIVADNSKLPNSRWYSGGGIYRPVTLIVGSKTHIDLYGVKVSTLSYNPARILVEISANGGVAEVEIMDGERIVAGGRGNELELDITDARLWNEDSPYLYTCHVTLLEDGSVVDEAEENFGIRKLEWNNKGLFINGKNTLLRGGCIHSDNGILGACAYPEAEERRVRILKDAGYNAIRMSHNPASASILSACDKYGMYVMDETFDQWYIHKNKYDYACDFDKWYKQDTESMIKRDFNHPSVIMYSIGNEVTEPYKEKGVQIAKEMIDYVHSIDSTRAVTAGINLMILIMATQGKGIYKDENSEETSAQPEKREEEKKPKDEQATGSTLFNLTAAMIGNSMNNMANSDEADEITSPILDALDIAGYNYASGRYPLEGEKHPNRIVLGAETFPRDIAKNWEMVEKYPYLIGDFMWTAWDYLGEAGIGSWSYDGTTMKDKAYPCLLAEAGAIDILGNIGAEAEYTAIVWGLKSKVYIGVRPVNHPGVKPTESIWRDTNAIASWSWKDCTGNTAEVEIYADAAFVKLYINDEYVGEKEISEYRAIFEVTYVPGAISAVAFDKDGHELSRSELYSAGSELHLVLEPETKAPKAGQLIYIPVTVADEKGIVESNADDTLTISITGGELLGFGSAKPSTEERFYTGIYSTHYGRALAIVRRNTPGNILIKAEGKNFRQQQLEVVVLSN